jgi:hypothetical protein
MEESWEIRRRRRRRRRRGDGIGQAKVGDRGH